MSIPDLFVNKMKCSCLCSKFYYKKKTLMFKDLCKPEIIVQQARFCQSWQNLWNILKHSCERCKISSQTVPWIFRQPESNSNFCLGKLTVFSFSTLVENHSMKVLRIVCLNLFVQQATEMSTCYKCLTRFTMPLMNWIYFCEKKLRYTF